MKVLIADDNIQFRARLASILNTIKGIEIIGETGNVSDTLAACRQGKPDAVILDIHMPGGSGLDVVAQAKATRNPPVVMMLTIGPRSEYQTESFLLGADYFFEKSSELRKMVLMLRRMAKKN